MHIAKFKALVPIQICVFVVMHLRSIFVDMNLQLPSGVCVTMDQRNQEKPSPYSDVQGRIQKMSKGGAITSRRPPHLSRLLEAPTCPAFLEAPKK